MSKLSISLERNIQKAIDQTPGVNDVDELSFVEAVLEALGCIEVGYEMRPEELTEVEEDDLENEDD